MAKTKLNPRRRPATQADVERAREQAVKEAVRCSMATPLGTPVEPDVKMT